MWFFHDANYRFLGFFANGATLYLLAAIWMLEILPLADMLEF